jgi:NADPH:quinone reductase-like Zn-dependent oxidoreductase
LKPAGLTWEQAAAVPEATLVALQAVRDDGKFQKGQKVLVYGASGGIGTFAVQIAKAFGAEVTGVCSTRNVDLVRSLGADHVIDYTREDFTKNGKRYDLIIATAGYRSIFAFKRALNPSGVYVCTGGSWSQLFQALLFAKLLSEPDGKKLGVLTMKSDFDFASLKELIEAGKVKPVIDQVFPLEKTGEAFMYYSNKHARGKVVISVG